MTITITFTHMLDKIILFGLVSSLYACSTAPNIPNEPTLDFISFSKQNMIQGRSIVDSVFLQISFTDGDGDIGSDEVVNMTIIDNRTGDPYGVYRVPAIPEPGANNGVTGTMTIKLFNTCCLEPNGDEVCEDVTVPSNELSFDIVLTDRAGNDSNRLTTPSLQLICF